MSADESPYDVDVQNDKAQENNPALEHLTLEELEAWSNLAAGLHFCDDLVRVGRLRSEASERSVQRQRRHARGAVQRTRPNRLTAGELEIQRETAKLYAQLTRLIAAGHLRWSDYKSDWVKRPVFTRTDRNRPPAYTEDELLDRFDRVRRNGKGWKGSCPAHDDKHPSLTITEGERGWLIKCWTGCTFTEITQSAGLEPQRMFYQ